MASRSYCFTINNYTQAEIDWINIQFDPEVEASRAEDGSKPIIRYIIYGREVGAEGTPHLQGYLELTKPMRMAGVKKLKGYERAHLEARRGSREQARDYCKKDGQFTEFGDWAAGGQGARNDLKAVINGVKEGTPLIEMIEDNPELISRHLKLIDRYQALVDKQQTKEFRHVEVNVLWGDAGAGKSRTAREQAAAHGDYFTVNPDDAFPFDGYNGEPSIVIDDFSGNIKYKQVLNILDGHQLRVNVKGSHRYARWNRVYITANEEPSQWYRFGLTPALARRLTNVTRFAVTKLGGNTDPQLLANHLAATRSTDEPAADNIADMADSDPELGMSFEEFAALI